MSVMGRLQRGESVAGSLMGQCASGTCSAYLDEIGHITGDTYDHIAHRRYGRRCLMS